MSLRVCTGVTGGLYWCHWGAALVSLGRMGRIDGKLQELPCNGSSHSWNRSGGTRRFLVAFGDSRSREPPRTGSCESCTPWIGFFDPIPRVLQVTAFPGSAEAFPHSQGCPEGCRTCCLRVPWRGTEVGTCVRAAPWCHPIVVTTPSVLKPCSFPVPVIRNANEGMKLDIPVAFSS